MIFTPVLCARDAGVPTGAPSVTQQVGDGGAVTVTWKPLPREQRGGCVRKYSIYIENNKDAKDNHTCEGNTRRSCQSCVLRDEIMCSWLKDRFTAQRT